jgi:hypothetical protein
MIEWVILGAAVFAAGGFAVRRSGQKRVQGDWTKRLEEVAGRVGGRASAGAHPELRAEVEDLTVTLQLIDIQAGAKGRAQAQVRLPDPDNTSRFYLGWDTTESSQGLEHVPEVPAGLHSLSGEVQVRADDPTLALRVMKSAALDLADIRQEAQARALELVARGGYLTLIVHGLEPTTGMLERSIKVTGRLAHLVDQASKGTRLPAPSDTPPAESNEASPALAPVPDDARCELCTDGPTESPWVRCVGCGAIYHELCFQQAAGCLVDSCDSARAEAASGTP